MGLGLGALALRYFSFIDREKSLGIVLSLAGLMALIGPPLVVNLGMDFSILFSSFEMIGKLLLIVSLLSQHCSFFELGRIPKTHPPGALLFLGLP